MNRKLLPQANTLKLIIKTFLFAGLKPDYTKEEIAEFNDFDPRQSDYYLGACIYLGLFDEEGKLTDIGQDIINNDRDHCKERIYELIIQDELTGKFFTRLALFPDESYDEAKKYAAELTRQYYTYSDSVICRRSSAMLGWCKEILDHIKKQ